MPATDTATRLLNDDYLPRHTNIQSVNLCIENFSLRVRTLFYYSILHFI